ncbi:MAG: HEPN domain-containing protein [Bacteroidota bacterium]|nr:HEPN domain-containing protein [Bacteroidota bacterium]
MKAITQEWLNFAKTDIIVAKNSLSDEYITNAVAFHAQQTVEKCFKATIEENDLRLKRIHNLIKLYQIVEPLIDFSVDKEKLRQIDEVYTTSRYPGDLGLLPNGKPSSKDAKEMYEFAKQIYDNTIKMFSNT